MPEPWRPTRGSVGRSAALGQDSCHALGLQRALAKVALAAVGTAMAFSCSEPAPAPDARPTEVGGRIETREVCNWEMRSNSSTSIVIGSLAEARDDAGETVSNELCRAIAAIHRGPRLTIDSAPFTAGAIGPEIRECVARIDPIVAGQIRASTGGDELEIIAAIAGRAECWPQLERDLARRFPRLQAGAEALVPSKQLILALEERRASSAISRLSIYDDVQTAIPIGLFAASDGSATIRCLFREEVPSGTSRSASRAPPPWQNCVRRLAG